MSLNTSNAPGPLLDVAGLSIDFRTDGTPVQTVCDATFTVEEGKTLAIVGESGSGKTLTSLATLGLLPPGAEISAGSIKFRGTELVGLSEKDWRAIRGQQISMIFQDPMSALNPVITVGKQIAEMFIRSSRMRRPEAREAALSLMREVGIPDETNRYNNYPHQFSGGMRQRVVIAIALALQPSLIIADEPTTALDVTVQAQVLRLLRQRCQARGMSMIIVSHDLGVVARSADAVAVMYSGRIVECGTVEEIFTRPSHPYTKGLMAATPERSGQRRAVPIQGHPPDPRNRPQGCDFNPRCPFATDECFAVVPALRDLGTGRSCACHHAERVQAHDSTGASHV